MADETESQRPPEDRPPEGSDGLGDRSDGAVDDLPKSGIPPGVVWAGLIAMFIATGLIVMKTFVDGNYIMAAIGVAVMVAFIWTARPGRGDS